MKLVNRYLLSQFLRILVLTLCAFVGIYLLIDFFERIGDFLDHQAKASQYLSYLSNSIPVVLSQVLPLSVLMTMVLTLGTLGRSNEITAMRAGGVSLWGIIRSLMLLVLLISGLQLAISEYLVPINTRNLSQLLEVELKGKPRQTLKQGDIWYRDNNRIIHIVHAEPQKKRLQGVTIFEMDDRFRLERRLSAPTADYRQNDWQSAIQHSLKFNTRQGDLVSRESRSDQILEIGRTPEEFGSGQPSSNEMNYRQLSQLVRKLKAQGFDVTRQEVDMHSRLAGPFTSLIMAFLGVPFALQRKRGSSIAIGIGLSLGIGVIYFILQSMVLAFGYSGALPPMIAAWSGNLIFLMIGVWLLLNTRE